MTFEILPQYTFPGDFGLVARETLNDQSSINQTQLTCCALNEPLRFGYGLNRVGALLLKPIVDAYGNLLLPFIIGRGEIGGVDAIEFESVAAPASMSWALYNGTSSQSVDPWLQAAWAAKGKTYADTLNGIAWGVIKIPPLPGLLITALTITARMKKVYDPRLDSTQSGGSGGQRFADPTTWTYSTNPTLHLADFVTNATYGRGEQINWPSVMSSATVNDTVVPSSSQKRRESGLMIDTVRQLDDIEETLRAYAGCYVVREGGVVVLVQDAVASSVFAFTNASGSANYINDSVRVRQAKRRETPTVVTVRYTDTTTKPWRELPITVPVGGPSAGIPWREQAVSMPGIQNASQAMREAIRRYNDYTLGDLNVQLIGTGEAVQLRRGDVVTLTDSAGLSAKKFRLIEHRPSSEVGLWDETLAEYDDLFYSDTIVAQPPPNDTILPLPSNPPAMTGVSATEDVYPTDVGVYSSRFIVSWTAPTWPQSFIAYYIIEVSQAGRIVHRGTSQPGTTQYVTPPLPENLPYVITVYIFSVVQVQGPSGVGASWSGTNSGKSAIPSDVVSLDAFEINGEVRAQIVPATDVDMTSHEYRYVNAYGGATDPSSIATQWTNSTLIDFVAYPATRMTTKVVPPGSWRLMVKGRDSVRTAQYPQGQPSANAKWKDITVTSDANAFLAASGSFSNPLLKNMALRFGVWVTDMADTWNSRFTAAMNTYGNPLWTYHTSGTGSLLTEIADVGAAVTGDWSLSPSLTNLSGTAAVAMELSSGADAGKTVATASTATPSNIGITSHGYVVGDEVVLSGCTGTGDVASKLNVRAWVGSVVDANTITLVDFAGAAIGITGTYTGSSGTCARWPWQSYATLIAKTTARFVRGRITTTGTDTVAVNNPIATYACNVIARPDGGFFTGLASGPQWVRFTTPFNKMKSLSVTASGATGGSAKYDKVETSGNRAVQSLSNALRFVSTSSQYVTCPNTANNALTTTWTIEAWFKTTGNGSRIIAMDTTAAGAAYGWSLNVNSNGQLRGRATINSTTFVVDTPSTVNDGSWHHAALTLSGGTLTLYLDGTLIGTVATSGTWVAPTSPLGIGALPPASGSGVWAYFFDGCIQEARVWNVARTQSQIQALMSSAAVGNESGLRALYHLNGTSGTTATDSQTNVSANNGTLTAGPSWRPLDGFDGYVFNSSMTQIAGDASWNAMGV